MIMFLRSKVTNTCINKVCLNLYLLHNTLKPNNESISPSYIKGDMPPLLFMITEETSITNLIFKLNTHMCFPKHRRVVKLKYQPPSFDNKGNIHFTNFEPKTNVQYFSPYDSKSPIEVNVKIQSSVEDIIIMLQRLDENYM